MFFGAFSGTAIVNFSAYGMSPDVFLFGMYLAWKLISGEAFEILRVSRNHLSLLVRLLFFAFICIGSLLLNGGVQGITQIQITQTAYLMFGLCLTGVLSLEFTRNGRLEDAVQALRASATFISFWVFFRLLATTQGSSTLLFCSTTARAILLICSTNGPDRLSVLPRSPSSPLSWRRP